MLKGKTALFTGSISGIGLGIAQARGISEAEVIKTVLLAAQPTKAFVTVEQVAALAVFLAGDEASSITGAVIPIDGGWTAH
jgi:3-hydroxybutyrate dehydrogenase